MIAMNTELYNKHVLQGDAPVLVEYWAPWCVYCRRIVPALEKVARQREDVIVAQVNIDQEPELARREQIEVIPTLVLYRDGKALGSIVAPESKAMIETFLQEKLSSRKKDIEAIYKPCYNAFDNKQQGGNNYEICMRRLRMGI